MIHVFVRREKASKRGKDQKKKKILQTLQRALMSILMSLPHYIYAVPTIYMQFEWLIKKEN